MVFFRIWVRQGRRPGVAVTRTQPTLSPGAERSIPHRTCQGCEAQAGTRIPRARGSARKVRAGHYSDALPSTHADGSRGGCREAGNMVVTRSARYRAGVPVPSATSTWQKVGKPWTSVSPRFAGRREGRAEEEDGGSNTPR
jgi:hypothetical protein